MQPISPLNNRRPQLTGAAVLAAALFAGTVQSKANAGIIETTDGRQLSGAVEIDADGSLNVTGADSKTTKVALTDAVHFDFRTESASAKVEPVNGALPAGWQSADIGKVHRPGVLSFDGNAIELSPTGWGLWSDVDSCQFVYHELQGDGQIVAQVSRTTGDSPRVAAGVMVRESLDPTSAYAAMQFDDSLKLRLITRPLPEKPIASDDQLDKDAKVWLRLIRAGDWFTAYRSKDGQFWQALGSQEVKLPAKVQIGFYAATSINALPGRVRFEQPLFAPGDPLATPLNASPLPQHGVVTTDGTARSGVVSAIDDKTVTLVPAGEDKPISVPLADVAWIFFRPVSFDAAAMESFKSPGVILPTGEFVETDVKSLADGKLSASSVLFGDKTFDTSKEVLGVVLKSPTQWNGYHVRTRKGVTYTAVQITLSAEGVKASDQQIPTADIAEIFSPPPAKSNKE